MRKLEGDVKKKHVTYKTLCPEEKVIIHMDSNKIDKCLPSIKNDIIYIDRRKKV